jgi:hypothetical protein
VNLIKVQYIHGWNVLVKPLWTMNIHVKYEGQKCKSDLVKCTYYWEEDRCMERINEGEYVNVLYRPVWK